MATSDRFLGGVAPRANPRTIMEATSFRAATKKEDRNSLSTSDKRKLQMAAETGLESKYDLLDNVNMSDVETLKAVYQMAIRTDELKDDMFRYDMAGIMLIPDRFIYDANSNEMIPDVGASPIDLFASASEVNLTLVKTHSEWMLKFGPDYHNENMFWTATKLLNSCSESLREKIEETVQGYPVQHRTGTVYFVLLHRLVLSSTPMSMRSVIRKLEDLKLGSFEGENVQSATSLIKGAVGLLSNNGATPSDIIDIAFNIMKTSSTVEFNTHVTTMKTMHDTGIKIVTLDELLLNVQHKYTELTMNSVWVLGEKSVDQESSFVANLTCFNCGEPGHTWRECPKEYMGGVGRFGRGNGGRFGNRGGRGRFSNQSGRGVSGSGAFRTPPRYGQAHVRQRGPITERWCGICGVWGTHATRQHSQAANTAATDMGTVVSDMTPATNLNTQPPIPSASNTVTPPDSTDSDAIGDGSIPGLFLDFT